ncbi:MAG TPA: sulfatase-like hydrolase/transferase [Opitutaceae bacterium]|nr:sulfatase-like hydrolase/transferase [Opitutaceae bacterium]
MSLRAATLTVDEMAGRPNILWIVTTQWRAQACGYAGDPNARTPRLDALAEAGADFAQAVTPHPFGPFARAALLTGVACPTNGVRDYYDPLPAGARTVATVVGECGYETAFFGKWHLAPRDPAASLVGEAHARMIVPPEYHGGFSCWEGFESGFLLNDPWLQGTRLPEPTRFRGYQSDVVCGRAAEWVTQRTGDPRPWFAVVSLEPPHPPYGAPAGGVPPRDPPAITLAANVPRGGEVETKARSELAGYYAHIEATDRAIGRLVSTVPEKDTIIVCTSVHGDMHGAHGKFRKGWPHEESIRVPLLVRAPPSWDGEHWRGRRENPVTLLDLPRWTTAWAQGRSPTFSEATAQAISMPSVVALPQQCDRVWRGIRTAGRKLILIPGPTGSWLPWLFFDLQKDPLEQSNLADDPACAREIDALITAHSSLLDPSAA